MKTISKIKQSNLFELLPVRTNRVIPSAQSSLFNINRATDRLYYCYEGNQLKKKKKPLSQSLPGRGPQAKRPKDSEYEIKPIKALASQKLYQFFRLQIFRLLKG